MTRKCLDILTVLMFLLSLSLPQSMADDRQELISQGDQSLLHGEYSRAIENYQQALDSARQVLTAAEGQDREDGQATLTSGNESLLIHVIEAYDKLILASLQFGDLTQTTNVLNDYHTFCTKWWTGDHPLTLAVLQQFAELAARQGNLLQAELIHSYVTELLLQALPEGSPEIENALLRYANFLVVTDQHDAALTCFTRAFKNVSVIATEPTRVLAVLSPWAQQLRRSQRFEEAAAKQQLIQEELTKLSADDAHAGLLAIWKFRVLFEQALLSSAQGDVTTAQTQFTAAIANCEEAATGNPYQLTTMLRSRAKLLQRTGQLQDAEEDLNQSLSILNSTVDAEDLAIGLTLKLLAGVKVAQQELDQADQLYRWSLSILEVNQLRDQARILIPTLQEYAQFLRQTGKNSDAGEIGQKLQRTIEAQKIRQSTLQTARESLRYLDHEELQAKVTDLAARTMDAYLDGLVLPEYYLPTANEVLFTYHWSALATTKTRQPGDPPPARASVSEIYFTPLPIEPLIVDE